MHDAYTIGIPVLVILLANLMNRADLKDFRAEMNARLDKMQTEMNSKFEKMQTQMDRRFDAIDAELRFFHGQNGRHEARLDLIEKRQS